MVVAVAPVMAALLVVIRCGAGGFGAGGSGKGVCGAGGWMQVVVAALSRLPLAQSVRFLFLSFWPVSVLPF